MTGKLPFLSLLQRHFNKTGSTSWVVRLLLNLVRDILQPILEPKKGLSNNHISQIYSRNRKG